VNTKKMAFSDLKFRDHPTGIGRQGLVFFPNGYGVSVVRFRLPFGLGYGSYTSDESEWELAVLKGNAEKWELAYDTPITDDVIGHLSEAEIEKVIEQVANLQ
jgi:hypothetical protein